MKTKLLITALSMLPVLMNAQPGSLDLLFRQNAGTGLYTTPYCLALQDDGKIVIGGNIGIYNGISTGQNIIRIHPDGTYDPTLNVGAGFDGPVNSIGIQSTGKIVVGGEFTNFNGVPRKNIARLNSDGTLDTTYYYVAGVSATSAISMVNSISIQNDDKIIIGGKFDNVEGYSKRNICRLNADGTLDASFNQILNGVDGLVNCTAIQPDGKIIAGGEFTGIDFTSRRLIARLNTDGSLDATFNPGTGFTDTHAQFPSVKCVAIKPNGKIVAGGWFDRYNGVYRHRFACLNSDGSLDTTFNPGSGPNFIPYSISVQPDEKVVIVGTFSQYDGVLINRIARVNADGSLDTTFNVGSGFTPNFPVYTSIIQPDGKIVVGGWFTHYNNISTGGLVRILTCYPDTVTDAVTACDSYTWIDGNTYTTNNNTATWHLTNAGGCDSMIVLNLTINNPTTGNDVVTACDSYTWINGITYTSDNSSAMFLYPGGAANGCDSMVILNLTINNSTTGNDVVTACDSYAWINGITYTSDNSSAMFLYPGGAASGCDSMVILNLTINNSTTGNDVVTACDSYTWIDGVTYTSDNSSAVFIYPNGAASGCDSMVILNLSINNSTTGNDVVTACDSYTWIDGNTYTANNNSATYNIAGGAANGCDSLVTLNLTINSVSDITTSAANNTITANNSSAGYKWLDCNNNYAEIFGETGQTFTATANGDYAVELTENGCVDTSLCVNITTVVIVENNFGSQLTMYPNPTTGKTTVLLNAENADVSIIVRDVLGKETLRKNYTSANQLNFTIEGETGVYFIEIVSNQKRAVMRLMKE
jgi:uncharacterized delta-60 repeat protein